MLEDNLLLYLVGTYFLEMALSFKITLGSQLPVWDAVMYAKTFRNSEEYVFPFFKWN